ncbi:hypothetical protein [Microbacterium sp. P04]|uniref:hypothetical protein n=1 Tax=Microbacterium sp. P04 TaxID=3366947 RepID=UPI003746D5CC
MRRTPLIALALGAVLTGAALAGCASGAGGGSSPAPTTSAAASPGAGADAGVDVAVAWLDGGAAVAVLTRGSSSCVPGLMVTGEMPPLQVTLLGNLDAACTRDAVLRGDAVAVTVDPSLDLEVRVSASTEGTDAAGTPGADGAVGGDVVLPGAADLAGATPVAEGEPSAGWATVDDVLALSTWGSSGCRPVVQDAAVTAPGEITVTLAEPAPDLVCTADFARRVSVIDVPDAEQDVAYELILTGDGYDATRMAIAGGN